MTISVKAPNGDVVQFPEGTSDDIINREMEKAYGAGRSAQWGKRAVEVASGPQPAVEPEGVGRAALTGLRKGFVGIPGLPGSIEQLGRVGIDYAARKLGYDDPKTAEGQALPTAGDFQHIDQFGSREDGKVPSGARYLVPKGMEASGKYYEPQTKGEKYAERVGEFVPGLATPGGPVQRAVRGVLGPAFLSEFAGQATEGTPYEPWARAGGAIVGGNVPTAAGRVVTPFPAEAARTRHVKTLANEGVTALTAGQRTGNRPLRWIESMAADQPISAGRARAIMDEQQRQYTRAVLRRVGENADEATPEVMRNASARIGAEFDRLTQGNDIIFRGTGAPANGGQIASNLARAVRNAEMEYENTVPRAAYNQFTERLVDDVERAIINGRLNGTEYQHWRSRLGRLAEGTQDNEFGYFLGQVQRALDDAMEATLSPADRAAWATARSQWGHLVEVRQAMRGAGEQIADGQITPARLRAADAGANGTAYVEDTGRYSDLARAGVGIMTPLPNSGTPARLAAQGVMSAGGAVIGSMAGGGAPGAGLGAIAGAVAPGAAGRVYLHPWVQGYLGNQRIAGPINAMNAEQRTAQAIQAGANAPQQVEQSAVEVKSFEDALKLKKGTLFRDPNGVMRIR